MLKKPWWQHKSPVVMIGKILRYIHTVECYILTRSDIFKEYLILCESIKDIC